MPWLETMPVEQRERFIDDHRLGLYDMTELCARYAISRKTGYKWLARYDAGGRPALRDHQLLVWIVNRHERTALSASRFTSDVALVAETRKQPPTVATIGDQASAPRAWLYGIRNHSRLVERDAMLPRNPAYQAKPEGFGWLLGTISGTGS